MGLMEACGGARAEGTEGMGEGEGGEEEDLSFLGLMLEWMRMWRVSSSERENRFWQVAKVHW